MTLSLRTLRAQLLVWLLAPMLGLWAIDGVISYVTVRRAMDEVHDHLLHASAFAIAEQVTLAGTVPAVDLPAVALELLEGGEQERVFYRVSYTRAPGAGDVFLTGYDDLPPPPSSASAMPQVYETRYRGEVIRIVAVAKMLLGGPPLTVLVQVAQTLGGRTRRTHDIVLRAVGALVLIILVAVTLVLLGVNRGLKPLSVLSREVERRSATELTPVRSRSVPAEVLPFVNAINDLLARTRNVVAAQRRFVDDASHQLRTPLAAIQAEAELALRQGDLGPGRAAVEKLRDHCRATSRMARQLLSLARAESLPEPHEGSVLLDLTDLAREVCTAFVPEALVRQVDLGFEATEKLAVRGHEVLIREALANLVDNALRHGASPGTVTVHVGRGATGTVWVAVEDDGPGIPAAERERVLARFYRARGTKADGCGLGLAIVHEIAQSQGAALRIQDGPGGRGLRVELSFSDSGFAVSGSPPMPRFGVEPGSAGGFA